MPIKTLERPASKATVEKLIFKVPFSDLIASFSLVGLPLTRRSNAEIKSDSTAEILTTFEFFFFINRPHFRKIHFENSQYSRGLYGAFFRYSKSMRIIQFYRI